MYYVVVYGIILSYFRFVGVDRDGGLGKVVVLRLLVLFLGFFFVRFGYYLNFVRLLIVYIIFFVFVYFERIVVEGKEKCYVRKRL